MYDPETGNSTINWDPDYGVLTLDGETMSPALATSFGKKQTQELGEPFRDNYLDGVGFANVVAIEDGVTWNSNSNNSERSGE